MILEIKNQIYETIVLCQEYLKNLNWSTVLLVLALLFVFFLRKWELKKILSFFLVILLFFILLVRIEAFLVFTFGAEGSNITVGIGRTIFLIIAAVVFIYHAAIKE
jgi:MFS superfamily sulfate permease-like transporter